MAIDETKLPLTLGADVRRVTAEGFPTEFLLDLEQLQRDWFKSSIVNMDTRLTTVQSQTDDNAAAITTETTARTSADAAMASQITTITANVGSNAAAITDEATARANADTAISNTITSLTATVGTNTTSISTEATARANADTAISNTVSSLSATVSGNTAAITNEAAARSSADSTLAGRIDTAFSAFGGNSAAVQVYFASKAAPAGASASYGVYLTANSSFGGMEIMALSGGGSAIGFTANQFRLTDSGTAQSVFDYNIAEPGKFSFHVPVSVQTIDIKNNAVTQVVTGSTAGGSASVTITTRGGPVEIVANYRGDGGIATAGGTTGTMTLMRSDIGGALISQLNNSKENTQYGFSFANDPNRITTATPTTYVSNQQTLITFVDVPAAGTYTYTVTNDKAGALYIRVVELTR